MNFLRRCAVMNKIPPCKGCNARETNCHAHCRDYRMWQRQRQEERAEEGWHKAREHDVNYIIKKGERGR